jgi:hypothetical protein
MAADSSRAGVWFGRASAVAAKRVMRRDWNCIMNEWELVWILRRNVNGVVKTGLRK